MAGVMHHMNTLTFVTKMLLSERAYARHNACLWAAFWAFTSAARPPLALPTVLFSELRSRSAAAQVLEKSCADAFLFDALDLFLEAWLPSQVA